MSKKQAGQKDGEEAEKHLAGFGIRKRKKAVG